MRLMDQDTHAQWQQDIEQEQRLAEEEMQRYQDAHPETELCPNHPDRLTVDRHSYAGQWCAECIAQRKANYADAMSRRDRDSNDPHNWPQERANQGGWLGHTFTKPERP